jgi:hypothetical protein
VIFNFALKYALRKVLENRVGPKLNETQLLLTFADDSNLLEDNIDTVKKTLIDGNKEVGLEIRTQI